MTLIDAFSGPYNDLTETGFYWIRGNALDGPGVNAQGVVQVFRWLPVAAWGESMTCITQTFTGVANPTLVAVRSSGNNAATWNPWVMVTGAGPSVPLNNLGFDDPFLSVAGTYGARGDAPNGPIPTVEAGVLEVVVGTTGQRLQRWTSMINGQVWQRFTSALGTAWPNPWRQTVAP
jgi:hypothetical protein